MHRRQPRVPPLLSRGVQLFLTPRGKKRSTRAGSSRRRRRGQARAHPDPVWLTWKRKESTRVGPRWQERSLDAAPRGTGRREGVAAEGDHADREVEKVGGEGGPPPLRQRGRRPRRTRRLRRRRKRSPAFDRLVRHQGRHQGHLRGSRSRRPSRGHQGTSGEGRSRTGRTIQPTTV